ncbi:hypothetical protein DOE78_11090 [Bacillus sp. Y1]|nr:hypothetical protein [Bacillus sp. Y1]AYA75941.1 hypothetical protein DOE78_11090 [Bacillus sp. Y1]
MKINWLAEVEKRKDDLLKDLDGFFNIGRGNICSGNEKCSSLWCWMIRINHSDHGFVVFSK